MRHINCFESYSKMTQPDTPPNILGRVLVEHKNGALTFAVYKDGMYLADGSAQWLRPDEIKGWMLISDLRKLLITNPK